jgi:uncharacterized RDD family membrane protein YckC
MAMEWFYVNGGNRVGPVTPLVFEGLNRDGTVKSETMVWSNGMTDWLPFGQIAATTAVCAVSGGRYWQRDMVPYEGKFVSAEHKEQFFQRLREGVQQPGGMVYGNFGTRFVAKLIDGVIGWVIGVCINLGLAMLFFGSFIFQPKPNDPVVAGRFFAYQGVALLAGMGFGLLYQWFFLSRYAATPGKMALGLKVVRSDGSPLSSGRAIGRYFSEILSSMTLLIGYIMAGFDEERRALHDRICDTRVIKTR